jgi:hypothetical protein
VPKPHAGELSATLVARPMGYLAVRVFFHREPMGNMKVRFYKADGGARGEAVGDEYRTDDDGRAMHVAMVPTGLYVCALERQEDTLVHSVAQIDESYPVVLPIGRPYVDIDEAIEFVE